MAYDDGTARDGFPTRVTAYRASRRDAEPAAGRPTPDRAVADGSLGRVLLTVTAQAVRGRANAPAARRTTHTAPAAHGPDLVPRLSGPSGAASPADEEALARAAAHLAVPGESAGELDAGAVAGWVTGHYAPVRRRRTPRTEATGRAFPAVVIGSPHGSAAHLAAMLGAAWLPTGFEFSARWPDGVVDDPQRALEHGAAVARRVLDANPDLAVRQVHDPVLRGRAAGVISTLFGRWRRLPAAYREFLTTRLAPGAPVLLVRDDRRWPVFDVADRLTFQLGSPITGLEPEDHLHAGPDLRQALRHAGGEAHRWRTPAAGLVDWYAEQAPEPGFERELRALLSTTGRPLYQLRYDRPASLSVLVAEAARDWLASAGKPADRLAVGCGRQLDPGRALRAGLVPYWCESALRSEVTELEWWLAGSRRFRCVDVLVEPPGRPSSVVAPIPQWRAVAWFGAERGTVDRSALRSYPYGGLPAWHASVVLSGHLDDVPMPAPPHARAMLSRLVAVGPSLGLRIG
jgi:hypothetical protein